MHETDKPCKLNLSCRLPLARQFAYRRFMIGCVDRLQTLGAGVQRSCPKIGLCAAAGLRLANDAGCNVIVRSRDLLPLSEPVLVRVTTSAP